MNDGRGGVTLGAVFAGAWSWLTVRPAQSQSQHQQFQGRVKAILGGDNILVDLGSGKAIDVDLAGMIPPTTTYEQLASDRLTQLLPEGSVVTIQRGWQTDNQYYGYVFDQQGESVNAQLIREGLSLQSRQPATESLRSLYEQAEIEAQLVGAGYHGNPQLGTVVEQPARFDFSTLNGAIPVRAMQVGGGVVAAAAVCTTAQVAFRRWQRNPERQRARESKLVQQQLKDTLVEQKLLERQYAKETQCASECRERAKVAVKVGDDELAKVHLTQAREHSTKAESLDTQVNAARHQVTELRSRLDVLNPSQQPLSIR